MRSEAIATADTMATQIQWRSECGGISSGRSGSHGDWATALRPPRPRFDRRIRGATAATAVRPSRMQYDSRDRGSTAATAVRPPRPWIDRGDRSTTAATTVRPLPDRDDCSPTVV